MKTLLVPSIAIALLAVAPAAAAQSAGDDASAEEHYRRGAEHYASGEYERAAAAFRRAFERNGSDQYLFAWAQSERLADDCPKAVELYRRLLDRGASEAQEALITEALSLCGAEAAEPDAEPDTDTDTAIDTDADTRGAGDDSGAEPPPEPAPAITAPRAPAPTPSRAGPLTLGAVGLIGLGAGTGFVLSGRAAASAEAATSEEHAANADRAASHQRIGAVSAAIGAGLIVGAAAWWLLDGDDSDDGQLAAWASGDGAGLTVKGRF